MPKVHTWIQAIRCIVCNKVGKVPDPNDPEKLIKCETCSGEGYHITRGKTKAD